MKTAYTILDLKLKEKRPLERYKRTYFGYGLNWRMMASSGMVL
jgi:hypothetical protein